MHKFLCKIGLHKWVPDKVILRKYEFTHLYTDVDMCERCLKIRNLKGVEDLSDQIKAFELTHPRITR